VRQHRRSTKADTRIPRTQGETSRPGHLADTSMKDWHRAQWKIECWAITRLARRGRRAEEPPRLPSTTHYTLQELGRPLITVFMSSCKRVYRRMPVAGHPFCYSLKHVEESGANATRTPLANTYILCGNYFLQMDILCLATKSAKRLTAVGVASLHTTPEPRLTGNQVLTQLGRHVEGLPVRKSTVAQ
jgi:hypothetical protein